MSIVYGVYYHFYAEGVEQSQLQTIYTTRKGAEGHNTMTPEELAWAGITQVTIEELEVLGE